MNPFALWFLIRILTSTFAAFVSSIKPITPIEINVPLFPPTAPVLQWLERVFISPWLRWDVEWYQRIVTKGYSAVDGTAQFHPLFPWLATPLSKIGISPVLSLLIISSVAGLALFYCFSKLALLDLQENDANYALMLFAFVPPAFILFAPYPEALFLLLAVLCLLFTRQKSWWLACMMGGLATLTRQQGIFLIIPVAWELWENNDHKLASITKIFRDWFSIILIPAGYMIWLIYRAFFLYDWQVKWGSLHDFIYSFMISPSSGQVVQVQQFVWPWQAIYFSLSKVAQQPDVDIWVNLIIGVVYLLLLALAWNNMRKSYRLYSLVIAWISFSYYTGPVHPYMGLVRHLYLAFPVFISTALVIKRPLVRLSVIGISALTTFFLLGLYVLHAWVP